MTALRFLFILSFAIIFSALALKNFDLRKCIASQSCQRHIKPLFATEEKKLAFDGIENVGSKLLGNLLHRKTTEIGIPDDPNGLILLFFCIVFNYNR